MAIVFAPLAVGVEALAEAGAVAGEAGAAGAEAAGEAGAAAGEAAEGAEGAEGESEDEQKRRPKKKDELRKTKHVTVTKTMDRTDELLRVMKEFSKQRVLVGIPSATSVRSDTNKINNAMIGMIMENGSPGANIPARPWLVPGLKTARKAIVARYGAAARRSLRTFDPSFIAASHKQVGEIGAQAVRTYMKTANFTALKPATVAARYRQRGTKRRRKGEKDYMAAVSQGMALNVAQGAFGIQPLINTGELLRSVTWVVRPKGDAPQSGLVVR